MCQNIKQNKIDMKCKDFKNSIVFYLDGELKKKDSAKFESHIENCIKCKELFEKVSSSYKFLSLDKITESNPFFHSRVQAAINNEKNLNDYGIFSSKKLALQIITYMVIGIFAISAGYLIASDKNYVEQKTMQEQYEVSDEELFADSHYLTLSTDDLYVIKTQEIEEH